MKKSLFVVSAFAALAMACEPVKEIPVVDVTMSYFAFKAENNPALKTDYFVKTLKRHSASPSRMELTRSPSRHLFLSSR